MRKSKRRFRDRALAWFLTLMMIVGSLYSGNLTTLNVYAEETSPLKLNRALRMCLMNRMWL